MDGTQLHLAADPERSVRAALARLEDDLRELALLALADWEKCGVVAPELFRSIAALQRPSWGHWNGLLIALREARRKALRDAPPPDRERVRGAGTLAAVLQLLDREAGPEAAAALRPLAELTRVSLARRPSVGALLTLPIALRNLVAHFAPAEAGWWVRAAAALGPLADLRERGELRPGAEIAAARPAPWFVEDGGEVYAFNGIDGDAAVYAAPGRAPRPEPRQLGAVLASFRRLLGKADEQEENLQRLLAGLVPEDLKGVLLGDYLVGRPVGSGGYSTVHVATQLSTGRKVAVKLLRDGLGEDARARLRQEAAFLSRLAHPNVIDILGYGEEAWAAPRDPAVARSLAGEAWFQELARSAPVKSYLAMEWVEGRTLEEVFQGQPRPDHRTVAGWLGQAAEALAAVHAAGLLHRDVKPGNLMVTGDGVVKLMDFGVARTRDEGRAPLTTPGRVLGTPAYMAPEQLDGRDDEVGPASDVYGVCATFYELFTGARLYHHDRETEKAVETRKLAGERPERPRRLAKGLPWEVETVLLGGLEPGPAERYRSAADVARDVRHYLRDEPIEYRRPGPVRRFRLFYRRQRALLNLLAAALLLAAAGVTAYIVSIRQEQDRTHAQWSTAERRLVRGYLREGVRQLDAGNPLAGLPFFAAALGRTEEAGLPEGDAHRLRLGAMFAAAPRRLRCLPAAHGNPRLAVSPDGRFLVTTETFRSGEESAPEQQLGELSVWDAATGDRLAGPLRLDDPVTALAFSTGCDRLLVGTGSTTGRQGAGEALVLTLPALERVGPPLRHPGPRKDDPLARVGMQRGQGDWIRGGVGIITAVAFTADGARAVTCSDEGTARLWDARTGQPVGTPLRHGRGVRQGLLTPDGAALVTADEQSVVRVWELNTGKTRFNPAKVKITGSTLALDTSGTRLATADYSEAVAVWDLTTGTKVQAVTGVGMGGVAGLAFSPGGDTLLVAERGTEATLWDVTGRARRAHRLPHKDLRSAAFSADGLTVVTVGDGVRFWNAGDGHECFPRLPDDDAVLHPDGHRAFTARDNAAWLWRLPLTAPCPVPSPTGGESSGAAVALAPDARAALFRFHDTRARPETVHCALVDTATGLPVCPGWSHSVGREHSLATAFRPDGGLVATAGADGHIEFRAAAPGVAAPPALAHPGRVTALAFRPDGALLATAGEDRHLRLRDVATGQAVGEPVKTNDPPRRVFFSPDGALLAAAAQGGQQAEVFVLDGATGRQVIGPLTHPGENLGVWVWPRPGRVVALGQTGIGVVAHHLYLWDLATGQPVGKPFEQTQGPEFNADGSRMLLNGRVVDTGTGLPVSESPERITAWLPAAGVVATSVRITETEPGFRVRTTDGQALGPAIPVGPNVKGPVFSPDARLLAALDGGAVLRVWEAQTGDPVVLPLAVPEHTAPPRFTPDGRAVVLVPELPHLGAWTLRVPVEPFTGPAAEAGDRARLLAGVGLDKEGGLARLDVRAEWERQPPPTPAPSPERLRAWHLARAAGCRWRNWAGAAFHLRRATEYGADGPEVYAALGRADLHLRRWAEARDALTRAVDRGGATWHDRAARAEAFVGLKEWRQALADYDAAVAAGAADRDVFIGRAAARAELGDADGAAGDLASAVHEYNDMGRTLTPPARDRLAAGDWRAVVALLDYLEARYRQNQFVLATTDALRPAEMYAARGAARFALGDLGGAMNDLAAAERAGGAGAGYRLVEKVASDRLALAPGDARLLHLRGLARSRLGEPAAALADLHAALWADPDEFRVWWSVGETCESRGRWAAAESAYGNGIHKARNPPAGAYYRRGWVRAEQRKWGPAGEDFAEYTRRVPAAPVGWQALGLARLGGGDRDGLRKALARLRDGADRKGDGSAEFLRAWALLSAVGDDQADPAALNRAADRLATLKAPAVSVRAAMAAAWCRAGRFELAAKALAPIPEKDLIGDPLLCALRAACAAGQGQADAAQTWTAHATQAAVTAGWQERLCSEQLRRRPAAPPGGKGGP